MSTPTALIVDGHAHLHTDYDLPGFLTAAGDNLRQLAQRADCPQAVPLVVLAECKDSQWLQRLAQMTTALADGLTIEATDEATSLRVRNRDGGVHCYLITGRQIVTREDLEILTVGHAPAIADGGAIGEVLPQVLDGPGVAALAWGVGKWLQKRGRIIASLLEAHAGPRLFVGDNRGRPTFWGTPALFQQAATQGVRVLAGSDPLPFAAEATGVGGYGFTLTAPFADDRPAAALVAALSDPQAQPQTVGQRDGLTQFFGRQSRMFAKKHLGR